MWIPRNFAFQCDMCKTVTCTFMQKKLFLHLVVHFWVPASLFANLNILYAFDWVMLYSISLPYCFHWFIFVVLDILHLPVLSFYQVLLLFLLFYQHIRFIHLVIIVVEINMKQNENGIFYFYIFWYIIQKDWIGIAF